MAAQRGFTLIELMVTVAIIAVLATLSLPVLEVSRQRAREADLRHALREIRAALDAYKAAADAGEIDKAPEASGYPPNLDVLVQGAPYKDKERKGRLYLLRRLPRDPMEPRAELPADATWALRSYSSEAADPQAGDDVYDVRSRSNKLGLNGAAYNTW
jgi:general secretion pathway protein G